MPGACPAGLGDATWMMEPLKIRCPLSQPGAVAVEELPAHLIHFRRVMICTLAPRRIGCRGKTPSWARELKGG
jgi:hypothetical protein